MMTLRYSCNRVQTAITVKKTAAESFLLQRSLFLPNSKGSGSFLPKAYFSVDFTAYSPRIAELNLPTHTITICYSMHDIAGALFGVSHQIDLFPHILQDVEQRIVFYKTDSKHHGVRREFLSDAIFLNNDRILFNFLNRTGKTDIRWES